MKRNVKLLATGIFAILAACASASAQETPSYAVPLFRHIDPELRPPDTKAIGSIRLLADQDFPPFSFRTATGEVAGLSVDLMKSTCVEMRLTCEIKAVPYADLANSLERGDGDAIISGVRLTVDTFNKMDATAPYYRAIGRFAVKSSVPSGPPDAKSLQDKKVGAVVGTGHSVWIKRYFPQAQLVEFGSLAEAVEALRTGQIELVFGDAIQLIYWIKGEASRGCCKLADGAFVDERYFSHPLSVLVKRGNTPLRMAFDYGLDRIQRSGTFATIFKNYVPLSPW
jgi:polar amino acid transport system substrate-binding protein